MATKRGGSHAIAAAILVASLVLVGGGFARNVSAVEPDPSDVVLVLDFSASILRDAPVRKQFGAALERIADRVDAISTDLVSGDATVSIVQFATKAVDYPTCVNLKLLGSPETVAHFADCLRSVASTYRRGGSSTLKKRIGSDTNYVAAMERAATHLPTTSVRPALILFTDGKHDVAGVPVSEVQPARDRLFGARTPFALLPVGMGIDPKQRGALGAGLQRLQITNAMPACVSGAVFEWPEVVFETAADAGNAVAVALQNATCTFSVAPTPTPVPTPTPAPIRLQGVKLTPGDGSVDLSWAPPVVTTGGSAPPISDYRARCRPSSGTGDWIESTEGVSVDTRATIAGLANGTAYDCEIAAIGVDASAEPVWTAAGEITPLGRPAAPPKPAVAAADSSVVISVPPAADTSVARYRFECSSDGGNTWTEKAGVDADAATTTIGNLANGTNYICRAFAENPVGVSDASPLSDAFRPCGSLLECNPVYIPVLGGLFAILLAGIAVAMLMLLRGRTKGHVIAVVDVVHSANVGHGSRLGIGFMRQAGGRAITGIVADDGKEAEIRVRRLRNGKFVVRDRNGAHEAEDGAPVVVTDRTGVRHSLVLRAFDTDAASEVARRR